MKRRECDLCDSKGQPDLCVDQNCIHYRGSNYRVAELDALKIAYNELLMAVAQKYPGETRHQTALRYIQQAENSMSESAQVAGNDS